MKKGTTWYEFKFWHDDEDYTPYRAKIRYEIEPGYFEEGRYFQGSTMLEIIEYPEDASDLLKATLRDKLSEECDWILLSLEDNEDSYETDKDRMINDLLDKNDSLTPKP
jgi:hypothetical protein